MDIAKNLRKLSLEIPQHVKIVAVSKTMPVEAVLEAYKCGQRVFGENKAQELFIKHSQLPEDIEWHMVGHLQTNKIKYIAPFVSLIHSVDSFRLLQHIDKEASKNKRLLDCLLQIHIADEETKFGFSLDEAVLMLESSGFGLLKNIRVTGVMGMATFTDNERQIRREFKYLKNCFDQLKKNYFYNINEFREISMGMTGDYHIAIDEGSTMLRIGTLIFGERRFPDKQ
ncbi:MAG: YggS family pyridoxal phosphate-dependent enzyme [Bacteroidota bacterium]